jgi:hypothetical protein
MVELSANSNEHEEWRRPIRTYFQLNGGAWKWVGLERMPDQPTDASVKQVQGR